jgi:hypothetical protein
VFSDSKLAARWGTRIGYAGDDQRTGPVAVLDNFQQVAALLGVEWLWGPIIEDQQIDAGKLPHQSGIAAVTTGQRQASKPRRVVT